MLLSLEKMRVMNNSILDLLGERIEKYTMGDSTSVPNYIAERILGSIIYCLKENSNDSKEIIADSDIKEAFYIGLKRKKNKIINAQNLYKDVKENFIFINNECYVSTILEGIDGFFRKYDVEFNAQYNVITLDYPLLNTLENLQGIDLIYEYIKNFNIENELLHKFDINVIEEVLRGYDKDFNILIVNITNIILRNAIICEVLNKDILELDIKDIDFRRIKNILNKEDGNIKVLLENSLKSLLIKLDLKEKKYYNYFALFIDEFISEIYHCTEMDLLRNLIPPRQYEVFEEKEYFKDGITIDNEDLVKIIDEMNECRCLSDKITILKENIHSLSDLKEVLNECFYNDEFKEVFKNLSKEELIILINEIKEKLDYKDELYEWEKVLINEELA